MFLETSLIPETCLFTKWNKRTYSLNQWILKFTVLKTFQKFIFYNVIFGTSQKNYILYVLNISCYRIRDSGKD